MLDLSDLPKVIWEKIDRRIDAAVERMGLRIKRELADETAQVATARRDQLDVELKLKGGR